MSLIYAIPVVVVIVISVFIVKIASVALNLTGLDQKRSFFQALSAFTGTGFTTRDSELVVGNDIRRRIIMVLMILGNAGMVSVITTLMLTFIKGRAKLTPTIFNLTVILLVVLFLVKISGNRAIARRLTKKIQEKLIKSPTFTKRPVEEVLRLAEGYGVAEVAINEDCTEVGKALFESSFRQKDILVLAIERGSTVLPAPRASDKLLVNDTLICYGKLENMARIRSGKKAPEGA